MKAQEIKSARRKAGLSKWVFARILRISESALLSYERGTKMIPDDVAQKVEKETARQCGRLYYGEAPKIINALVSELISLDSIAAVTGTTKAKIRACWGGDSKLGEYQLQALLEMEKPVVKRRRKRVLRRKGLRSIISL